MLPENPLDILYSTLTLPPADLKIIRRNGVYKVFDRLRKKHIIMTPEEFVRQNFVNFMIEFLHYPESLMANEIGINLNGLKRRCDTVVFNTSGLPIVIVEYKAPSVIITQQVFDQIARYNMCVGAKCLIVSNGIQHYCCNVNTDSGEYSFLDRIPEYQSVIKL